MESEQNPTQKEEEEYEIEEALFSTLLENGFSENAIKKSIAAGCIDEKSCTAWIKMHESHPDLNTALEPGVVVRIKPKKVLTAEEKAAKLQELKDKIERKKKEEKMEAYQKEIERIRFGRKTAETQADRDKLKAQVRLSEMEKEKREDAEARRRIKLKLLVDKQVRQGKSEEEALAIATKELEETEEAARRETEEKRKKYEAENQSPQERKEDKGWNIESLPQTKHPSDAVRDVYREPTLSPEDIPLFVQRIKENGNQSLAEECVDTLKKIFSNILQSPFDTKMRTFNISTKTFSSKIIPVPDAIRLLRVTNFDLVEGEGNTDMVVLTTVILSLLKRALDCLQS